MELPPNQFGAIDEGATRALGTYTRRSTLTSSDNAKAQRLMSEAYSGNPGPAAYDVYRTWTLTEPVGPYSLFGRPSALGPLPDMYIDSAPITDVSSTVGRSHRTLSNDIGPYQLPTRQQRDFFGTWFDTPSGEQTYSGRNVWRRRDGGFRRR